MIVSEKDGFGNTRPNSEVTLVTHLDYLRTIHLLPLEDLELLLSFVGGKYICVKPEVPWTAGSGTVWYDNTISSKEGIRGGYTIDLERNTVDVMLDFSGEYFSGRSVIDQWNILRGLYYKYKAKCSRIDLAVDDSTYSLIPVEKMREAAMRGDNFKFSKVGQRSSGKCGEKLQVTDYYGSRNSGKMVRVYDHDGECQRFETEFKRVYSRKVFELLATIERQFVDCIHARESGIDAGRIEELEGCDSDCMDAINNWLNRINDKHINISSEVVVKCFKESKKNFEVVLQKLLGSIAVSAIDFRDKSKFRNRGNASYRDTTRLSFYQKFMDLLGGEIRVKAPRKQSTIQKTVDWVKRAFSKTYAIFCEALSYEGRSDYLADLQREGKRKMGLSDYKLAQYLRDNRHLIRV